MYARPREKEKESGIPQKNLEMNPSHCTGWATAVGLAERDGGRASVIASFEM